MLLFKKEGNIKYKYIRYLVGLLYVTINLSTLAQTGKISLTSPTGSKSYISNSKLVITWSTINVEKINLDYSIDSGKTWFKIVSNQTAFPAYYIWKLPQYAYQKVWLRISDAQNLSLNYMNSQPFIILNKINKLLKLDKETFNISGSTRIMLLGNSITEGVVGSAEDVGYRRRLDSLLNSRSYVFDFVGSQLTGIPNDFDKDHEGHGGWHADHPNETFLSVVDSVYTWLTNNPTDYILLHICTNDLGELELFGQNSMQQVDDVSAILDSIDKYEINNAVTIPVFLARIINRTDNGSTTTVNETDTTTAFNLQLQQMVDSRIASGDVIIVLNQEAALQYPSDLDDGIHPNDNGYFKMADKWFMVLNSYFQKCPENTISYWKMNETGTISTIEDKLGLNNGNCTGSACPQPANGMNFGALSFDGIDDVIQVSNGNYLSWSNALNFSEEVWVKTTQTGSGNKVFIGKYDGKSAWWIGFNASDGKARFSFRSSTGDDLFEISSISIINDGFWHQIVGVKSFDDFSLSIFVDGVLENSTQAIFNGSFTGINPITIGCFNNDFYFSGELDELAIYDRSLRSDEILAHYNDGLRGRSICNENEFLVDANIYLQGSYTSGVMSTNLNVSGSLPLNQPYYTSQFDYQGAERVSMIPNNSIVDWVLLELRTDFSTATFAKRRAAFLKSNGDIVDLDGSSPVSFSGLLNGDYYLVIHHRNHLSIMSSDPLILSN